MQLISKKRTINCCNEVWKYEYNQPLLSVLSGCSAKGKNGLEKHKRWSLRLMAATDANEGIKKTSPSHNYTFV